MKPKSVLAVAALFVASGLGVLSKETTEVTCGSVIKLQHLQTGHLLHSHDIAYGSGSGQQSVTGFTAGDDANSYWIVRGTKEEHCPQGTAIQRGRFIRLQHQATRRWLHSHQFRSPLSGNLEVSCFGDDSNSDNGDVWKIDWDGKIALWQKDQGVKFHHTGTKNYLGSHDKKFGRPIAGQTEICCMKKSNSNTLWAATEGVYFPQQQDHDNHDEL